MSTAPATRGRLIALEGSGGRSMTVAAKVLQREIRKRKLEAGSSAWDASDLFFQIGQGARGLPGPSPRTLVLLYASDLAFRLRWQIRPAMEDGTAVIAAPYLETVIGSPRSGSRPQTWLREVFEFAPAPDECYRVPENPHQTDRRSTPVNSFLEFSLAQLRTGPGFWNTEEIRSGCLTYLQRLEGRGKCRVVAWDRQE